MAESFELGTILLLILKFCIVFIITLILTIITLIPIGGALLIGLGLLYLVNYILSIIGEDLFSTINEVLILIEIPLNIIIELANDAALIIPELADIWNTILDFLNQIFLFFIELFCGTTTINNFFTDCSFFITMINTVKMTLQQAWNFLIALIDLVNTVILSIMSVLVCNIGFITPVSDYCVGNQIISILVLIKWTFKFIILTTKILFTLPELFLAYILEQAGSTTWTDAIIGGTPWSICWLYLDGLTIQTAYPCSWFFLEYPTANLFTMISTLLGYPIYIVNIILLLIATYLVSIVDIFYCSIIRLWYGCILVNLVCVPLLNIFKLADPGAACYNILCTNVNCACVCNLCLTWVNGLTGIAVPNTPSCNIGYAAYSLMPVLGLCHPVTIGPETWCLNRNYHDINGYYCAPSTGHECWLAIP